MKPAFSCLSALFVALLTTTSLTAQTVRGIVVEQGSGSPIGGALIVLVDEGGSRRAASLSHASGAFMVEAPGPGRYRLHAERIGFQTGISPLLELTAGEPIFHRLEVSVAAIMLNEIRVEARQRCVMNPSDGLEITRVWDEARKALRVSLWTEQDRSIGFRSRLYTRTLDPVRLQVQEETTRIRTSHGRAPFESLPAERLLEHGFAEYVDGAYTLYAPAAEVLLSDAFMDSHCFRVRAEGDLIGLAFEPASHFRQPGIQGVFWLDRQTAELRNLEYTYANLRLPGPRDLFRGRVEFERLPTGAWIVQRWWIRSPVVGVRVASAVRGEVRSEFLRAVREDGGEVLDVLGSAGRVGGVGGYVIEGMVIDSTRAAPLAGASVYVSGTGHSALTDSSGGFRIPDVAAGRYRVGFMHPRLDTLGINSEGVEADVGSQRPLANVQLSVPSLQSIYASHCSEEESRSGIGIVAGSVRNTGTGVALPGAEVMASWRGGRVGAVTDAQGRYRICGLPDDIPIAVDARMLGSTSERAQLDLSQAHVMEHDIGLALTRAAEGSRGLQSVTLQDGPVTVVGRLLDAESLRPIVDARVRLIGSGPERVTDRQGRFTFREVQPAVHELEIRHVGYGTRVEQLNLPGGGTVEVDLRLPPRAVELAGVTVTARSEVERLQRSAGGSRAQLDRSDLDELETRGASMAEIVRERIPGLRVREGSFTTLDNPRRPENMLCIESSRGATRLQTPAGVSPPFCDMVSVFIDDVRISTPGAMLRGASLADFERVEFLSSTEAGVRYGLGSDGGVLLLHTRGRRGTAP
jgi:hypothetical protein